MPFISIATKFSAILCIVSIFRKDAAFDKNYLNGRYGAIPSLDNVATEFE